MTESADRQSRLEQAIASYLEAVDAGSPPDQGAFLNEHADLKEELQEFFQSQGAIERIARAASDADDATMISRENPVPAQTSIKTEPVRASRPPRERISYFGDYELLAEIARGGMGVVYRARQVNLDRIVAIKMILSGQLASADDVARFYQEAEAAANLDHPGIVPIYEVGEQDGQHFFSMGFVEGESLAHRFNRGLLKPKEAATLIKQIAGAVHYAHDKGVIHRDLKPANILLNPEGQPRITDFGLAKKIESDSGLTATGQVMGTPSYMSPEQAGGRTAHISVPTDIYALGAILYAALTGRPPFQADNAMDTVMQVLEREPISPRELNVSVPKDLETICLKCLEKDRQRRYGSAEELAEELGRFLQGQPILARPVSRTTRLLRWCRRNPAATVAFAAISALLLTAILAGIWINTSRQEALDARQLALDAQHEAEEQRNEAREQSREADRQRKRVLIERDNADRQRKRVQVERDNADRQRKLAEQQEKEAKRQEEIALEQLRRSQRLLYASQVTRAQREWNAGDYGSARDSLEMTQDQFRGWEYQYLQELFNRNQTTLEGHTGVVSGLAVTDDGKTLVSGSWGNTLKLWNLDTGKERKSIAATFRGDSRIAIDQENGLVLTGSWDTVQAFDLATGELQRTVKGQSKILAFSPDGKFVASTDNGGGGLGAGVGSIWDSRTGEVLQSFKGHESPISVMSFSPDGKTLWTGSWKGVIKVWDVESGELRDSLPPYKTLVGSIVFNPAGTRFATNDRDDHLKLWDAETYKEVLTFTGHEGSIVDMAFSPDGKQLVSGGQDQTVRIWNVETGEEQASFIGHDQHVVSVAWTPDGQKVISAGYDKTIKIWNASGDQESTITIPYKSRIDTLTYSPDGKRLYLGGGSYTDHGEPGDVKVWDAATGKELGVYKDKGRIIAVSPDSRRVASGEFYGRILIWDANTGDVLVTFGGRHSGVHALAFSPDGKTLVSGSNRNGLKIWDAEKGIERRSIEDFKAAVQEVTFSPDGRFLVTAAAPGSANRPSELILWDAKTWEMVRSFEGHKSGVSSAVFSPDGKQIVSGSRDKSIKIWDVATGKEIATLNGHTDVVSRVSLIPDGTRIISGSYDGTIRLWDAKSFREVLALQDGGYIAVNPSRPEIAGSTGRAVRIWSISP